MSFKDLSKQDRKERVRQVLKYLVFLSGYTQQVLADKLDIKRSTVGHILTGERYLGFIDSIDWIDALGENPTTFFKLLDDGVGLEEDWTRD